jgi:hypothetical protein
LDPGFLEHLRLSPRAVIGPGARFLEFLFTGPHADDETEKLLGINHMSCGVK